MILAKVGHWVLEDLSVLDELSSNLNEVTGIGSIGGNELGDDGQWLRSVDLEFSLTIEVVDSNSVWVEIATIFVAMSIISMSIVISAGDWVLTSSLLGNIAWMGSVSRADLVGFPNVELGTASTHLTHGSGGVPVKDVGLTINEFNVVWALGITVTRSILGTDLVVWELGFSSILVHLDEVESSIDTTWKLRDVNGEGELLVLKLEQLVVLLILHHVHS